MAPGCERSRWIRNAGQGQVVPAQVDEARPGGKRAGRFVEVPNLSTFPVSV